ncbi:MAG: S9 family peptidase [Acidobacteria bacterium]|nr:S9 family peptidase [Acidobacteriota bacterium]
MLVAIGSIAITFAISHSQTLNYPKTRKTDHVDVYHGVRVPDPYRWLEDDKSEETARWVEAENKVTHDYLARIPERAALRKRLEELYNYAKYSAPTRRGEYYFFSKNDGLQNQSVLYKQKGLSGPPELLLDPNRLSADGTSKLVVAALSNDGRRLVYTVSAGGSDWQEAHVIEVATLKTLDDRVQWIKASGLAWAGDGFFYSRYPAPADGHDLSAKNENHQVYFHRVGTPQSADELIYSDLANPQRFHQVETTQDGRFALLSISERGKGADGNALYYRDLSKPDKKFLPIVTSITNDHYNLIDDVEGGFLLETTHSAPNSKVVRFNTADSSWTEIVPEKPEPLSEAVTAGGRLFVAYLKDVATRAYVHTLDGKPEREIVLPGVGTAGVVAGNHDDSDVFYTYASMNYPPAIFRYDIRTAKSSVFRSPDIPGFNADKLETKQVFYQSKDGTRVPMFLAHRKGLKLDGTNPTILYGYGGFNITEPPRFNSLRQALFERGFVFAIANIRGGGEYGEKWHQAGMREHKQNVFDDFVAAAEWLIAQGYTSPKKLAVTGGSNGGLLVGAVINQRPDLFRAAVPQVGVMDMLRFHQFTIGWNWIPDYGSSDNEKDFRWLYAYSPLHNIRPGEKYPATLVTTADHDDRVVPAHSFKYAATLQEKASAETPILIRIDTKSGHGASNTSKLLDQTADVYAFLVNELR